MAFEHQLDMEEIRATIAKGGAYTHNDVQFAIGQGVEAFFAALSKYEVTPTYAPLSGVGDGRYDRVAATIAWKA